MVAIVIEIVTIIIAIISIVITIVMIDNSHIVDVHIN